MLAYISHADRAHDGICFKFTQSIQPISGLFGLQNEKRRQQGQDFRSDFSDAGAAANSTPPHLEQYIYILKKSNEALTLTFTTYAKTLLNPFFLFFLNQKDSKRKLHTLHRCQTCRGLLGWRSQCKYWEAAAGRDSDAKTGS